MSASLASAVRTASESESLCSPSAATSLQPPVRMSATVPSVAAARPGELDMRLRRDLALEDLGDVADVQRELLLRLLLGGSSTSSGLVGRLGRHRLLGHFCESSVEGPRD